MKQSKIKYEIEILLAEEKHEEKMMQKWQELADEKAGEIMNIRRRINEIQAQCKHEYGDQKPDMMGKGICIICGDNDY